MAVMRMFGRLLQKIGVSCLFGMSLVCAHAQAASEIRVGESIDMTGINGDLGKDFLAGARVYFDYINSSGGIHGKKIALDVRDNHGSIAQSKQITQDFLTKDKVDVLFGYYGEGVTEATADDKLFIQSGIPLVAPFSGATLARTGNIYFLRPSYIEEVQEALRYVQGLGLRKLAVVYNPNAYGHAALQAVKVELQHQPLQLVAEQAIRENNDADMTAAIQKLKSSGAQATLMIMETLPAADFVKIYHPLSPGALLLGLSQINHETLMELAGKTAAAGVVITQVVPHPGNFSLPAVRELDKLMKKYRDEAPSHLTMEGYLAAKLLVRTLERADTPKQISQVLDNLHNLDLGGFYLSSGPDHRVSSYVDITAISSRGGLLH
ncbi:MAG: ABC transporter substrate-binding protein [Sulfuriferula sp.]|nr:ABC transporter substrate-binding protein [Sulfuriferula sp.]